MHSSLQGIDISESWFGLPEDSIVEDEPLGEPRYGYAERLEVLHRIGLINAPERDMWRTRCLFYYITERPLFYRKSSLAFPL